MIDIVILAVLIIFVVLGWRRGLVRTLTELLTVVLALALASQIARAAAPKIVDQYLRPATHAAIEQRAEEISKEAGETTHENLNRLMEAIPNGFIREKAIDTVDGMFESGQILGGYALVPLAEMGKELADHVLDTLVRDLIQSILCAALCVILTALFRLLARVLCLLEKLPGVKQLNELGGALIGLAKGLILVVLVLWVLRKTGFVSLEMAEKSAAFGLLSHLTGGLLK